MAAVDAVRNVFLYLYPGSSGIGKRVFGNCREIAGGDQVCEMLWRHVLVLSVLIDGGSHVIKIFFENGFIAGRSRLARPAIKSRENTMIELRSPALIFISVSSVL